MKRIFKSVRIFEVFVSMALFGIIVFSWPSFQKEWNKRVPIEEWFKVNQLVIGPRVMKGHVPEVIYDREAVKDFSAYWIVEIQRITEDSFSKFCSGSGNDAYKKDVALPYQGVSIDWLTDKAPDCVHLKDTPGKYRMIITWFIDRGPEYYPYRLEHISNIFEILDAKEMAE